MSEAIPESILAPMRECPDYPDYPTAWAIQHDRGDRLEHHPECSSRPGWRMLCDCGAVTNEWKRLAEMLPPPASQGGRDG